MLFDEDVPRQLRQDLSEYQIRTVQEQGWSSVQNGELLRLASREYDVFVTADKNLQRQQNIRSFDIGVVVIGTRDTRLPRLKALLSEFSSAIATVRPGEVVIVGSGL